MSDERHLLLVTTGFPANPASYRGIFVFRSLKQVLKKSNYKATVITPAGERQEALLKEKTSWSEKFKVIRYHYFYPHACEVLARGSIIGNLQRKNWLAVLLPFLLFRNAQQVFKYMFSCDVIHCQWIISGLFPALFKKLHKKPVVVTVQGSDLAIMKHAFFEKLNGWILRRCDRVIPMSRLMDEQIQAYNTRTTLVANGVDTETFYPVTPSEKLKLRQKHNLPEDKVLLLYVGMLIPVKGLDLLVEAAKLLKERNLPGYRFLLVGDGLLRKELEQKAKDLGCDEEITFIGSVLPEDIRNWNQLADIALSSSHSEGVSTALCEAAACSLPIVSTRAGETEMVVDHKASGYIVEDRDVETYANHCARLIRDSQLRVDMGQKGLEHLKRQSLTSQACAEGYLRIYDELLTESSG